jgi:predicted transcriptional regulator of viral defense system
MRPENPVLSKPKSFTIALKNFYEHNGILTTAQAKELGIQRKTLTRMLQSGLLIKEARGIYRLANIPTLNNPDLVQISLRVPAAVICLVSALAFHDLTTQIPHKIYIALPQFTTTPRIDYPPLEIVRVADKPYQAGIEEHSLDGVPVRIYSPAKTVADCFKFRNKVGEDVALEALKDYLRRPAANIEELLNCARIDRVEKIIAPFIRASL